MYRKLSDVFVRSCDDEPHQKRLKVSENVTEAALEMNAEVIRGHTPIDALVHRYDNHLRAAKFLVEYKILTTVEDFMTFKDKSIIKKAYPDIYNVLMAACLAAKYKHEEDELIELKKEILKKYPKKPLAIHHGFSEKQINQVRTGLLFDVGTTFFKNINELVDQRITESQQVVTELLESCGSLIEKMKIRQFDNKDLDKKAAEYVTCNLPVDSITKQIVPGLFGMIEQLLSTQVKEFVKRANKTRSIDTLVHLSGEGKTCRLLAYGAQSFLIYINCAQGNDRFANGSEYFRDESYKNFQMELENTNITTTLNRIASGREEVLLFLIGRVMFLILCIKVRNITPFDFLMAQVSGNRFDVDNVCKTVRKKYQHYTHNSLKRLLNDLVESELPGVPLGVAIDEINAHTSSAKFYTEHCSQVHLSELLLEGILEVKENFNYIAVAGTRVNLEMRQAVTATIGKITDLGGFEVYHDAMPVTSSITDIDDLISFLELHIKKDKINFDLYRDHLYPLLGRKCLAANFLHFFLRNIVSQEKEMEEIIKESVSSAYNEIVSGLTSSIKENFQNCQEYRDVLELLIYCSITKSSASLSTCIDLQKIGLTRPSATVENEFGEPCYEVHALEERCAIDACVRVAKELKLDQKSVLLDLAIKSFELSRVTSL